MIDLESIDAMKRPFILGGKGLSISTEVTVIIEVGEVLANLPNDWSCDYGGHIFYF